MSILIQSTGYILGAKDNQPCTNCKNLASIRLYNTATNESLGGLCIECADQLRKNIESMIKYDLRKPKYRKEHIRQRNYGENDGIDTTTF